MRTVLMIIAAVIILFDVIMVTPFGFWWSSKKYEEGKPMYSVIIVFVSIIPLMFILEILGLLN